MRLALPFLLLGIAVTVLSLAYAWKRSAHGSAPITPQLPGVPASLRRATFAAGCFWGVEATFRRVQGVVSTTVGYTGGQTKNPTYEEVCTDQTGHAEAVLVIFDPAQVTYEQLLDVFWSAHDPTTKDMQGPDAGTQYRSAIFYHDAGQEQAARASLKEVGAADFFMSPIVTEIVAAGAFYPAEDYHQHYFAKNGGACHVGPAEVHTALAKNSRLASTTSLPAATSNP